MIKIVQREQECLRQLYAAYLRDTAFDALHYTTKWCCNRHPGSGFQWRHFFKGQLLYQDPEGSMYYGDVDDPERKEILRPSRKKRKGGTKSRATTERKPLITRLLAWRASVHSNDPLESAWPPSFIIDNRGIKLLAKLHPSNLTHSEQIVTALDETQEWQDQWSRQIFEVIQAYDRELAERRKDEAARFKARQKRVKREQDRVKFAEVSNEIEERIRQDVLRRHSTTATAGTTQTASGPGAPIGVENVPIRRSSRLQSSK
ncbi:hypothetical protein EDB84DRAFT_1658887 [Lactarius hengduanensis]|nr:hypothetical protein EDB84DRAFT_1658887 [Lactarius hengduanensis]